MARRQLTKAIDPATRYAWLLERLLAADEAQDDLLRFAQYMRPDPTAMEDPNRSLYQPARPHRAIANALHQIERGDIRRLIITVPPRHGKACAHDTPVLTPQGWTTHGALRAGDWVYGPDGLPTRVLALSADVDEVVPVTLSNGEVIRCHPNHEWTVFDRSRHRWATYETREMARLGLGLDRARFQLPDVAALVSPPADLPVHPYALGAWLGDGSAGTTRMAHHAADGEVIEAVEACGYPVSTRRVQPGTGVAYADFGGKRGVGSPFQRGLAQLGVYRDKHIPELYLRASRDQRLQLLAGLVDTDGHVEAKTGRVRFSTCSEALRDGVHDLCGTLGFRPYVIAVAPTISSSGIVGRQTVYQIGFQADASLPTRVPRKAVRVLALRRRVGVVSIGPVERAGARSIQVDREDGLYLVGRKLNPTHNTELASKLFIPWVAGRHPDQSIIFASYNETFATDIGRSVRAAIQSPLFGQVFPDVRLRTDSAAADRLEIEGGGLLTFAGRGGTITGRGGHLLVCDDPIKDRKEADSPLFATHFGTGCNKSLSHA